MTAHEQNENLEDAGPPGGTSVSIQKGTGPRTSAGKERSKRNALKHGIFSKVALLENESRSEFDSLLTGLRIDRQPEGTLEEALVEKLAVLMWRYRRFLVAERAEIRKSTEFDNNDKYTQNENEKVVRLLVGYEGEEDHSGLMQTISSPRVSEEEACLRLLRELEMGIKKSGFDPNRDSGILTELYGKSETNGGNANLFKRYRTWLSTAESSGEKHQNSGSVSNRQCVVAFLTELQDEIKRVERYRVMVSSRRQLEIRPQYFSSHPRSERLLRYETSIERNFDRTLSQLERLQRMRRGQPVLPKLEVQHTLS